MSEAMEEMGPAFNKRERFRRLFREFEQIGGRRHLATEPEGGGLRALNSSYISEWISGDDSSATIRDLLNQSAS
jgi:hypothetical protein